MKTYEVTAPVAGVITEIKIKQDDVISAGDVLAILEVMKMENEILSEVDGNVIKVEIEVGQTVDAGQTLFTIDIDD